ncbi:hypothetical protein GJ672_03700 [Spiribacter sp. 2438]|nr:hypothetical protein [Spiribacter sp. 2438]QGM21459.1 hypothetical protein GJ672_03700 [Spiribacter sp. 2438]
MIKDRKKAAAVQERRFAARKRGYSKAVRRFMRRAGDQYSAIKAELPVRW